MNEWEKDGQRSKEAAAGPRHGTHAEILLVDRDPAYRKLMRLRLHCCGFLCHSFPNAEEAVEFLNGPRNLDAAIVEHDAASHGGGKLLRTVQETCPGAAIVGSSTSDRRAAFQSLGVNHFLRKPWNEDDLNNVLAR